MSRAGFWVILGLDPIEDRGAVRKAYAAKLKEIDPEVDPKAFIRLREAHDEALDWLRWQQFEAEDARHLAAHDFEGINDEPLPEIAPEAYASPWLPKGETSPTPARIDADAIGKLERLLFDGDPDAFPDPVLLQAVVRRILSDPAMVRIDSAEGVSQWLADVVADSIPRSDPIVGMVAEHFGWTAEGSRWDRNPSIDFVVARHEGLSLLDRLANPKHKWHEAYLELTSDKPELGWNWVFSKKAVKILLEYIRAHAPEAEGGLNACRVSLWEDKLYGVAGFQSDYEQGKSQLWWTIPLLLGLSALGRLLPDDSRPKPPPAFEQRAPVYVPERVSVPTGTNQTQVFDGNEITNITEAAKERLYDAGNRFAPLPPQPPPASPPR